MSAASDCGDALAAEIANLHGIREDSLVATSLLGVSSFSKTVQTPGPDVVFAVDSEGMVLARGNVLDWAGADSDLTRQKSLLLVSTEWLSTKLVLFVRAPSPDLTRLVKCQGVIRSTSNLCDVFEFWNQDGSLLNLDDLACVVLCESSISFVVLGCLLVKLFSLFPLT